MTSAAVRGEMAAPLHPPTWGLPAAQDFARELSFPSGSTPSYPRPHGLSCVLPSPYVEALTPGPQRVTGFGDRVCTEVTSDNEVVVEGGSWPSVTGSILRRGDQDTDSQRDNM